MKQLPHYDFLITSTILHFAPLRNHSKTKKHHKAIIFISISFLNKILSVYLHNILCLDIFNLQNIVLKKWSVRGAFLILLSFYKRNKFNFFLNIYKLLRFQCDKIFIFPYTIPTTKDTLKQNLLSFLYILIKNFIQYVILILTIKERYQSCQEIEEILVSLAAEAAV